jgi:hypothetical protein
MPVIDRCSHSTTREGVISSMAKKKAAKKKKK